VTTSLGIPSHRTTADADVGIVGLGGIGSAAAYWAGARGASVVGFERFEFGHDRGASHDHSRIIRYSYHTPGYVELSRLAYRAWEAVEAESGDELVLRCGGLDLFPAECAIAPDDYRDALDACAIPYDWLDAAEIRSRWPQFRIDDDVEGLFQADGGIAAAARGVAAHQRLAIEHRVQLHEHARVETIREVDDEVEIVVDGRATRCGTAIIAADAWTNELLAEPLPLTVLREQVTYFDSPTPDVFAIGRHPVWIWMDEPSFYGFPTYGECATKVAQDCGGYPTTANDRNFVPNDRELRRVEQFARRTFGNAIGTTGPTRTCLYTLTPDRDFVLDRVPGTDHIWVVQGAAHAYKFASILGRLLVECALDGDCAPTFDRSAFAIDRPALTDPAYVANWMV
jgi:sarcosine oxidase